jgi:hypothetical protein
MDDDVHVDTIHSFPSDLKYSLARDSWQGRLGHRCGDSLCINAGCSHLVNGREWSGLTPRFTASSEYRKLPASTTSEHAALCSIVSVQQVIHTHLLGSVDINTPKTIPIIDEQYNYRGAAISGMSQSLT